MGRVILVKLISLLLSLTLADSIRQSQDLRLDSLLSLTAIVPLSLLLAVYLLPKLSHLLLPRKWIKFIRDLTSSPASFDTSTLTSQSTTTTSRNGRGKDRKLWILLIVGGVEALAWLGGAVSVVVETVRNGQGTKQGWIAAIKLVGVALGWVRYPPFFVLPWTSRGN